MARFALSQLWGFSGITLFAAWAAAMGYWHDDLAAAWSDTGRNLAWVVFLIGGAGMVVALTAHVPGKFWLTFAGVIAFASHTPALTPLAVSMLVATATALLLSGLGGEGSERVVLLRD